MNNIELAKRCVPILDGIYKRESLTADLLPLNADIRFDGVGKISLFETDMDGFGDYSRADGFPIGSVSAGWTEYQLTQDRGISLAVDAMDNEESLGMAFGTLVPEFMRTKEIPELDAYRFSQIASTVGISGANADITVGTTDCPALIDTAEEVLDDDEVPVEGRILYVSNKFYNGIKQKITRILVNENGVNREVETFNGMVVRRVPKNRFNTAITLKNGKGEYGFSVPAGSYPINFIIIHPTAVRALVKHEVPRIWTPGENINADAYKFDLRTYHDLFVLKNKKKGIYVHRAASANS